MAPKALSLTYVQYEDTPLDLAFALCTFVPFVIGICQVSCVFINRCLEATFAFLGLVASTGINAVLKSLIKEPRPEGSHRHDYGMPSDHSQFMAFALVYLLTWFYHSGRVRAMRSDLKSLFSVVAAVTAIIVMYSRVRLGVHSVEQVFAGACVGACLGATWHWLGHVLIRPKLFPWIARSRFGRLVHIKNSAYSPGVQQLESKIALVLHDLHHRTSSVPTLSPERVAQSRQLLSELGVDEVVLDRMSSGSSTQEDAALTAASLAFAVVMSQRTVKTL